MFKDSIDIRQKEFIGVVLPDPRKENNGMFGGMMGGLLGTAASAMSGGLAGVALGAIGGSNYANSNGLSSIFSNSGLSSNFGNIISDTNLIPSAISMGLSSLGGGSFLNFGGALSGLASNTPQLPGLMSSFNAISGLTNGFSGLVSAANGLDNNVFNNIEGLSNFATSINSSIPTGITNTLFNSIGLNIDDLGVSQEILNGLGLSDSNPINMSDIFSFNGIAAPFSGGADISSVKSLGNQVATEPDGNIKVLVHIPELMYHIEEEKGIWCFNRLVTTSSNTSGTNSGMLGGLAKGTSGYASGSALGGGDIGSALGSVGNSNITGTVFSGISNSSSSSSNSMGSNVGSVVGTMIGGPIGGAIGGAIGGVLGGDDEGSGSDGAYGPLQPGTKVFIRFTENDYNTGNIVGIVHEEEDAGNDSSGIGSGLLGSEFGVDGVLGSSSNTLGGLSGMANLSGFANTVNEFSTSFSEFSNDIFSLENIFRTTSDIVSSQLNAINLSNTLNSDSFISNSFINSFNNSNSNLDNVTSSLDSIGDIEI
jgi:hypothetical protein